METIIFLIRFNGAAIGTFTGSNARRRAEVVFKEFRDDNRYTLHAVTPVTRRVQGVERWILEKDRARGASALLKGKRSKLWRGGDVNVGTNEVRIA